MLVNCAGRQVKPKVLFSFFLSSFFSGGKKNKQKTTKHFSFLFFSSFFFILRSLRHAETCMSRPLHTPWQPLQNHLSDHFGGRSTPWPTEEMLNRQHQRVDIPVHARIDHNGLLQNRLKEDLC